MSPAARRLGGTALTISSGREDPASRLARRATPVTLKLTGPFPFTDRVTSIEIQRPRRTRPDRPRRLPRRGALANVIRRSVQLELVERTAKPREGARANRRSVALVTGASIPAGLNCR